jgi:ABC-type antimicrobial peptide transport system permease subunit
MARTAADPQTAIVPLRRSVEALHARLVMGPAQTLDELVDQMFVGIDVMTEVLRGFGYLALLLAALGTYGVLAYNVAQRAHEIGIRMAVGAQQQQVVTMIVRQGIALGALGILIGAPFVFALVRALNYALQGLGGGVESGSAVGVGIVLLVTTLIASLFPALRAARMHPVEVLRGD